ncbi:expressed unknown protein [Seminavis robusta]|uniref:Uncharacterized protein n=1 Tax=Seminavis robusta TaxID=568900 RepID=A0A9N8HKN4_9STRA|nr:expressed unknown protein [Seminavis robusta]|eukprot:Sro625_g177660.1 n/a (318) ;mRNA; r:45657-46711
MAPRLLSVSYLVLSVALLISSRSCDAFSAPKGSAAAPLDRKKIAVIGAGGYMGATTFGFLQRAGSLYETGIAKQCRCIGATAGTAQALNTYLGSHFILAQADESFIKLTNMQLVESIQNSLQGYDAIILGNSMAVQNRPITPGTFETGPNSKTPEIFWDFCRGNTVMPETQEIVATIVDNILEACQGAQVKHVLGVATGGGVDGFTEKIQASRIPYTVLQCSGTLSVLKDYTYRKGVQGNLKVVTSEGTSGGGGEILREDIAAMCVQCLQSLDWDQSRIIQVESTGPVVLNEPSQKRPDQEWCVNSHVLAGKLRSVQ